MMSHGSGVLRALRAAFLACAVLAAAPTGAPAQATQDGALDRVHNLIATGRFTEAGNTLAQWERSFADPRSAAQPAERARALFLRAQLTGDAAQAEDAYVAVVLSYPSSSVAPEALLRLGQALMTAGEPRRAAAYLERLRSDYPGTPQRETGLLWLARAQLALGSAPAACTTAREGAQAAGAAHLRTLFELERDRACAAAPASPAAQTVPPPTARQPAAAPPGERTALSGDYAVQTGAFREHASAQNIATRMRAGGFDVRVVVVDGSPLFRVRVGAFATPEEAAAATRAIRDAGFTTVIVSDVQRERR
jgi:cell division septation protein DedD